MISFPPAVLGSMRAAADSLMTDTCTIDVQAEATGDMGEVLYDQYTVVATDVKCRVITVGQRFGTSIVDLGNRETLVEMYRLVCPYDTALAVDQRITLDSDGSQWQVVTLLTERTDSVDAQAVITRIQG
jgi:hypothetical protein